MTHIDDSLIRAFAGERVNLPAEKAREYREQVNRLREGLAAKIADTPEFGLIKMLHSGSVAKGTALRTVNDLDVAVYVAAAQAPGETPDLLEWLRSRLVEANPSMKPNQFSVQEHCVTATFAGSGLDVDVVPVLYEGDANDVGYLIRKWTGERVKTSIPLHLEFIRKRKADHGPDFAQLIRITKWWKRVEVARDPDFRFKSFMQELLWAHLADSGVNLGDYAGALETYFKFIVRSNLAEMIWFSDYSGKPQPDSAPIAVIDPVNAENNVAARYASADRDRIVEASQAALDALAEARFAPTKTRAIQCWQVIFGSGFAA